MKGSPHTLVIAGAGIRAADLTRSLRTFETKEAKVAKLFAKHIKLKEAVETCKSTRMNIGVGTPQRIHDLLDDGMLIQIDQQRERESSDIGRRTLLESSKSNRR